MTSFSRLRKYNQDHDELGRFASGAGEAAAPKMTMTQVSQQKGSNPGGVYKDALGTQYYVKFYKDPNQGKTEALASSLFEMLGARTPKPQVAEVNGKPALVTPWNANLEQISPAEFGKLDEKQRGQVARMYMGAILTKNWDVVGTGMDNIVRDKTNGDMIEVDTGGSFKFRAQGEPKPYGPDIGEHQSLLDVSKDAGKVFTKIFNQDPQAEQNALAAVKSLDLFKVRAKFLSSGLPDSSELYENFRERRKKLLENSNL